MDTPHSGGETPIVPAATDGGAAVKLVAPDAGPVRFTDAVQEYLEDMLLAGAGDKHRDEEAATLRRISRARGWQGVRDFTDRSARRYFLGLKTQGRKGKTLKLYWETLDRFGRWCVKRGLLAENPMQQVQKTKFTREPARYVPNDEEVARIIAAAHGERRKGDEWLVILTAAAAGPRWRALYLLEVPHIKLDHERPHIDLPPSLSKNRKRRIYPLTPELVAQLRAHLERIGDRRFAKRVKRDGRWQSVEGAYVFKNVPKHRAFLRTLRRAGLATMGPDGKWTAARPDGTSLSFHSLRHYFSNRKYRLGYTPEERRATLGHETQEMTLDVYTDPALVSAQQKVTNEPPLMPGLLPSRPREKCEKTGLTGREKPITCEHDQPMIGATGHRDRTAETRLEAETVGRTPESADPVRAGRVSGFGCPSAPFGVTGRKWAILDSNQSPLSGLTSSALPAARSLVAGHGAPVGSGPGSSTPHESAGRVCAAAPGANGTSTQRNPADNLTHEDRVRGGLASEAAQLPATAGSEGEVPGPQGLSAADRAAVALEVSRRHGEYLALMAALLGAVVLVALIWFLWSAPPAVEPRQAIDTPSRH